MCQHSRIPDKNVAMHVHLLSNWKSMIYKSPQLDCWEPLLRRLRAESSDHCSPRQKFLETAAHIPRAPLGLVVFLLHYLTIHTNSWHQNPQLSVQIQTFSNQSYQFLNSTTSCAILPAVFDKIDICYPDHWIGEQPQPSKTAIERRDLLFIWKS